MGKFVKHRNSKRLSPRGGGRFVRQPSLEKARAVRICKCGGIVTPNEVDSGSERFPMPQKEWPTTCHHCGEPL